MQHTREFFKRLHPNLLPGEQIELRSWGPNKEDPAKFLSADYDELTEWVVKEYSQRNVFVGVLPRTGGRGKNENIERAYWLWADLDSDKLKKGGKSLENYINTKIALPPTMLVASHGEHGGFHAYWAIEPTTDLEKFKDLNTRLCAALNSDAVQDFARILRVVGTLNHKYSPPIPVRMWTEREIVYTFEDVEAALALPEKFTKLIYSGSTDGFNSRSERDYAAMGAMIRAGYSDDLIRLIFTNCRIGDKYAEPDAGEHYLSFTLEKLRKHEQPTGPNKWGIIEKDGCYWRITSDGTPVQISTFVFEPEILLEGDGKRGEEDTLLGTMVADGASWPDVPLGKKAFADNAGMAKSLPKAAWQWLGKDADVRRLLPYLLDKLKGESGQAPTKVKTSVLGRHGDVFVLDGQVIGPYGVVNHNEAPIVWLPAGKDLPSIQYQPINYDLFQKEFADFMSVVFNINDYDTVLLSLGWLVASFYKPVLDETGVSMPVLNLFGTRGAGKTTLVTDLLQRLAGYTKSRTYDSNTTRFVMLSLLGCSNATPISFSEFRSASMRDADQLPGYIRLSYDSGHDNRGRSDQTMVDYPLSAPFTVDGEDAISDAACLERTIQLNLRPETIREGSVAYEAMQKLQAVNLNAIGYELVKYTLQKPIDFEAAHVKVRELYGSKLPNRVGRNFALILAGIWVLQDFSKLHGQEFALLGDEKDLFERAINNLVNLDTGRTTLPVDDMITDMILFVAQTEGIGSPQFVYKYDPDTFTMFFNLKSVYSWWARKMRSEGKSIVELPAMKQYVKERVQEDLFQNDGDYITDKRNVSAQGRTHLMYSVSLPMARRAGLDVPDSIERIQPKIVRVLNKTKDGKNA